MRSVAGTGPRRRFSRRPARAGLAPYPLTFATRSAHRALVESLAASPRGESSHRAPRGEPSNRASWRAIASRHVARPRGEPSHPAIVASPFAASPRIDRSSRRAFTGVRSPRPRWVLRAESPRRALVRSSLAFRDLEKDRSTDRNGRRLSAGSTARDHRARAVRGAPARELHRAPAARQVLVLREPADARSGIDVVRPGGHGRRRRRRAGTRRERERGRREHEHRRARPAARAATRTADLLGGDLEHRKHLAHEEARAEPRSHWRGGSPRDDVEPETPPGGRAPRNLARVAAAPPPPRRDKPHGARGRASAAPRRGPRRRCATATAWR